MKIELKLEMPCPRCGTELLLAATVPHPRFQRGRFTHTLCARCNVNDPAAQGLIAFFVVTPVADVAETETFAHLVQEWVDQLPDPPVVSPEAFEADVEAFYRGEFDE